MARTQKRKVGRQNQKTAYSESSSTFAVHAVNSNSMSIRKAAKKFKIPFGTLRNNIKGLPSGKVGRPFRLSTECEDQVLEVTDCLATWKVPLTGQDLCHLVQGYLDSRGVVDSVFKNNLPGPNWLDQFVCRHGLTKRLADNVKISRAEITTSTISNYFDLFQPKIVSTMMKQILVTVLARKKLLSAKLNTQRKVSPSCFAIVRQVFIFYLWLCTGQKTCTPTGRSSGSCL